VFGGSVDELLLSHLDVSGSSHSGG
jgi:hypothetical protein